MNNEDSWAELHQSDFIRASETLSRRRLCLLVLSPYQQELLRRGVQRHREDEASMEALDQSMGYAGAVGMMLLWEMASVERRAEEQENVISRDLQEDTRVLINTVGELREEIRLVRAELRETQRTLADERVRNIEREDAQVGRDQTTSGHLCSNLCR